MPYCIYCGARLTDGVPHECPEMKNAGRVRRRRSRKQLKTEIQRWSSQNRNQLEENLNAKSGVFYSDQKLKYLENECHREISRKRQAMEIENNVLAKEQTKKAGLGADSGEEAPERMWLESQISMMEQMGDAEISETAEKLRRSLEVMKQLQSEKMKSDKSTEVPDEAETHVEAFENDSQTSDAKKKGKSSENKSEQKERISEAVQENPDIMAAESEQEEGGSSFEQKLEALQEERASLIMLTALIVFTAIIVFLICQ